MNTREKRLYDYRGFDGSDASIAESLYVYGLIWQKRKKHYHFIIGVDVDDAGMFISFDWGNVDIDVDLQSEYNWADFDDVADCCGMSELDWHKQTVPQKIENLIKYYGRSNIFGDCCTPFEILGNEQG